MEVSQAEPAVPGARTCAACGYDLRGQVEPRCPECGTTFDPRELPVPPIPWVQRAERDAFGAYWATVGWVLTGPLAAGRTIAGAWVFLDVSARRFRRIIVGQAVVSALLLVLFATVRAIGDPGAVFLGGVVAVVLIPGITLFFWGATQTHTTPRWWWARPMIADHAEAVQNFATAPLALLPIAALLEAAAMICSLGGQRAAGDRVHQLALTFTAGVMVGWWACTVLMIHASRIWDRGETIAAGVLLLVRWTLLVMLVAVVSFFFAMCALVPLRVFSG